MVTLGTKNLMNGLGQKAKDAIVKGVKVASMTGVAGAAAVGVAKAITSVAGVNPNAVRSRSGAGAVSFLTGGRY